MNAYIWFVVAIAMLIVVMFCVMWFITANSGFRYNKKIEAAFADLDDKLKKRMDLVFKLIEGLNAQMDKESKQVEDMEIALKHIASSGSAEERFHNEAMLAYQLEDLFFALESDPINVGNREYADYKRKIFDAEKSIIASAERYNELISEFEAKHSSFPYNIYVAFFNFSEWPKFGANGKA